jgi:hypothetical protein
MSFRHMIQQIQKEVIECPTIVVDCELDGKMCSIQDWSLAFHRIMLFHRDQTLCERLLLTEIGFECERVAISEQHQRK